MGVEAGPRELGQTDTAWSALEGPQGCQNTQPLELYKSLWEGLSTFFFILQPLSTKGYIPLTQSLQTSTAYLIL